MSRLPVHTVDSAPDASRDALKGLEARVGKVLNIYGGMAHSPAVLHAYVALNQAITEHSSLDAATREAIALAVGAVNDCAVAREAATDVGAVSDTTWQAALDAGWSDTELADAFASVAANLFTNYFNHFADTELDLPAAPDTAT